MNVETQLHYMQLLRGQWCLVLCGGGGGVYTANVVACPSTTTSHLCKASRMMSVASEKKASLSAAEQCMTASAVIHSTLCVVLH